MPISLSTLPVVFKSSIAGVAILLFWLSLPSTTLAAEHTKSMPHSSGEEPTEQAFDHVESTVALGSSIAITYSKIKQLSQERQWLDLLHYHQVGLFPANESQVDDPNFFLSKEGKYDPEQELLATLKAFGKSNSEFQKYQCLYPARATWISEVLGPGFETDLSTCADLNQWLEEISPKGLTLIFPAAYLNSPSSMFGHTLMRIDSSKHTSPLLSYSINYAAADPEDNELVFSYKGLTGGYPGVFSVLPYYEKVKEYNYLESRDVWEYQLDIEPHELNLFMLHVWEVKDARFDYYFFTENCSYHLLTLLDAASTRFALSETFSTDVIPADTVRALSDAKLIKGASFRASMQTSLNHKLNSSTKQVHALGIQLSDSDTAPSDILADNKLTPVEQAQGLDLSIALARYRAKQSPEQAKHYNRRSISLLSARSKFSGIESFSETPTPTIRDDQGHRSHRWMLRTGHDDAGNYLGLDLRMSYHDFLDPVSGYIPGARLEILNFKIRAYPDGDRLRFEEFRAIDIASFSPRNDFVKPTSWFVSTGLTRNIYQSDELMPYLTAGPGLTYALPSIQGESQQLSALASTRLFLDNDISKGHTLESGPKITWLLQDAALSVEAYWQKHFKLSGANFKQSTSYLGFGFALTKNTSVRLGGAYHETAMQGSEKTHYQSTGELALAWYF